MLNVISTADLWLENMLLGVRTPFFLHLFNWITLLGNTITVLAVTGIVVLFLLLYKKSYRAYAVGLAAAVIGAGITSYMVKIIVERARPGGLIPSVIDTSFSFPSGHATLAMALYGFLTYLLCKAYPKHTAFITALAVLFILAIGFSRLYLGVHFPSDIIAGYLLGVIWLLIGIKIASRLKRNDIIAE